MRPRSVNQRRRYDNSGRAEQAAALRGRILDAAYRVLEQRGYAATTISAVAAAARVSRETVPTAFGTKLALVRRAYDVRLVGDEVERPLSERPEYRAMAAEPSAPGVLVRYAGIVRGLYQRLGPLLEVLLLASRAGEPELRSFGEETDRQRLTGATRVVELVTARSPLRPEIDPRRAIDIVWTLNSPDLHHLLTARRWSPDEYEAWLARSLVEALLAEPHGQFRVDPASARGDVVV